jgi:hypothetical protein
VTQPYPKSLSPVERQKAAEAIRSQLKNKTGQERKEIRAELMDPGPGDSMPNYKPVGRSLDEMRVAAGGKAKDDEYEQKEASAIAGENKSRGSMSFNYGHNKNFGDPAQAARTRAALKTPKQWKTRTPRNAESEERRAIQSEGKGSTKFP